MNSLVKRVIPLAVVLLVANAALVQADSDGKNKTGDHPSEHAEGHADEHPNTKSAPHDRALIEAIIADIAKGWETADGTPFRQHFLDFEGARYVESGGQNEGLTDLVEHHVEPEGHALAGLTLDFTDIDVNFEHGFAWAVAAVSVKATINSDGSKIDKKGYETFLFRDVGGTWKVVHTHSSTR